jgi:perosamine synthetase
MRNENMEKLALLGGEKVRSRPFISNAIIGKEEKKRVMEVLDTGILSGFVAKKGDFFLGGKQVRELESLLTDYFETEYAISVNSATAGLHVALSACGIGPGDEVIVPPYTMSASATAILMLNAIPVFADIDEETFCIDPEKIKKAITPKTRAIVVVHLFGYPADMDGIMKLARKHDIRVIEDCAQAPGAIYKGKLVGAIGDVGVFSFNQHKTVTCGEGGFAITNDERLALRMQLIRNHGEAIVGDMGLADIDNIIGYNYRMTELEAAVSIGQFKRLDFLNEHRIGLAEYLTDKLSGLKGLMLPKKEKNCKHVFFTYPIKFKEKEIGISRDEFVKALNAEGIPFGGGYVRPIYLEPAYQQRIGYGKKGCPFTCNFYNGKLDYSKGLCPVTEKMHEKELMMTSICRYPHTKKDMDYVVRAFRKIFNNIDKLKR